MKPDAFPDAFRDTSSETLSQALARAARVLDAQQPPPTLRQTLLQRVTGQPAPGAAAAASSANAGLGAGVAQGAPRARRLPRGWAWSGGAAVAAMLTMGAAVLLLAPPPQGTAAARGGEFMPLVPREDWPAEASPAWLVRSEVPQDRLAALGLPYDPARAAERVRAELLVHPSGLVLALRLID